MSLSLEEIKEMAEKDLVMDSVELDKEALRIPQLHNKYLNFLTQAKMLYKKQELDFLYFRKSKWEYYTGKISDEEREAKNWPVFQHRILKQDIPIYMDGDTELSEKLLKLEYTKQKIEFLESTIKGIMNRHWVIRSTIDWKKFTNGVG